MKRDREGEAFLVGVSCGLLFAAMVLMVLTLVTASYAH